MWSTGTERVHTLDRRVEEEFQDKLRVAYKAASKATKKKKVKPSVQEEEKGRAGAKTEFDRREDRRSVNDVAQAPPSMIRLPRKATKTAPEQRVPVSGVQMRLLAEERERAIERYREMKKRKATSSRADLHHDVPLVDRGDVQSP